MGTLENFDPTPAVHYWLAKKKRHLTSTNKSHQQEWFNGVFERPPQSTKKNQPINSLIKF